MWPKPFLYLLKGLVSKKKEKWIFHLLSQFSISRWNLINLKTFSINFLLIVDVIFGAVDFCSKIFFFKIGEKKYTLATSKDPLIGLKIESVT